MKLDNHVYNGSRACLGQWFRSIRYWARTYR